MSKKVAVTGGSGQIGFGGYITVRDVACGCLASGKFHFKKGTKVPYEAFFLTASNTFYPVPTLKVLKLIYGKIPPIKDKTYFRKNPYASVFDIRKAQKLLGWKPQEDWYTYEKWEL